MKTLTVWCDKRIHPYRSNGIVRLFISFLFVVATTSFSYAAGEHDHNAVADSGQMQPANTYCPVMTDKQINPEIFTDYKGKKVYFCCYTCKAAFDGNPEKYLEHLPQFGGTSTVADNGHEHRLELARLIKPMGIITLSLLVSTVLAGLFRRKRPKLLLKWHKRLAIITLVSAIIHAILVLTVH